jgi:hypothetical protein
MFIYQHIVIVLYKGWNVAVIGSFFFLSFSAQIRLFFDQFPLLPSHGLLAIPIQSKSPLFRPFPIPSFVSFTKNFPIFQFLKIYQIPFRKFGFHLRCAVLQSFG